MQNIMKKKRVLVYPCGTEIGLEIYKAVHNSIHFELIGGSSSYDHGRFVYEKHLDNLPFITDKSEITEIILFNNIVKENNIDYIYPAMDGVLYKFAEFKKYFDCEIIAPDFETAKIIRSKKYTYQLFKDDIEVPLLYSNTDEDIKYPLFMKPDIGQGSQGANKIHNKLELEYFLQKYNNKEMLLLEYLPGEEYTIDCFTNNQGKLIYAAGRGRRRIKNGISVNAVKKVDDEFLQIAQLINSKLHQRGGWFFQLKKNNEEKYSLLEISSRIAGTSAFTRNMGINLSLMTLHIYAGNSIDSIINNNYEIELDRAFHNKYLTNIKYSHVYLDFDDTIIVDNNVNIQLIAFIFQCINENIPITLLTRHKGILDGELKKRRLNGLFDEIILLKINEKKSKYIKEKDAIFVDDSYGERADVRKELGLNVFDTHMVECLLK